MSASLKINLTDQDTRDYSFAQVLSTPKTKRHIASDNVIFLRPLFSMVGRARNTTPSGNNSADFVRLIAPDRPHIADGQLPIKETKIMSTLTILSTKIRQLDGLYSLNDIHKASGGVSSYKPANWLRNQQAIDLIELLKSEQSMPIISKQGLGTYVCRELVIAYAAWISAAFHLKVIRVFLNQTHSSLPAKIYDYPRKRLEQPFFASIESPARLCMSMLADTKEFTSQVKALLNELRTDGHNVDAAWDEYQAMIEAVKEAGDFMDEVTVMAIKARIRPASTSLRD